MLEQNRHIARQFIAAFAAGDTRTLDRIVAEHMIDHTPAPGAKQGRRGVVEAAEMFRAAFPDLKVTIESLVADDDRVSVTGKISVTNRGTLMGAPPSG
jgi:predicted ester cyclase